MERRNVSPVVEIVLDERVTTNIEVAEDALGEEVYYNYLKISRKLVDETDMDEERVYVERNLVRRITNSSFVLLPGNHHKRIC